MADYWKSNPKKYCELCKCWMADNKISIQNHENGMRHKASVAKKVNELTRSNKCAEMEKKNLEACLQQINDSAHLSMMKDLERDPSLAKQYGIVLAKSPYGQSNDESNKMEKPATNKSRSNLPNAANIWKESITPDGKHYYWNVATRATQWTRPNGIIEPEQRPPTEEKTRLKEFVLNRLVELSESGSTEANEAVLQAFNVPPSNIEPIIKKLPNNTSNEAPKCSDIVAPIQFQGPRVDLLGPWVPCDDIPKPKLPKLDLPDTSNDVGSFGSPDLDEKLAVIAHLEKTTGENLANSALFNPKEEVTARSSCSAGDTKQTKNDDIKVEQSNSNTAARIVFRRRPASNRSIRTSQDDE
ncbi:WW domain-binding protein 4 [Schistosoma japonicum]|nr:WW domain-binding protein 4 [Schistosoma japonicum]